MKIKSAPMLFLAMMLAALAWAVASNPPGGVSWRAFWEEPAALWIKLEFLGVTYLWPAALAFTAIVAFQLQFRLAGSGAGPPVLFAASMAGSVAMVTCFRGLSAAPHATPSYMVGMATGYTVMARLYAVRMRTLRGRMRVPWPVWRGNLQAVQETDRRVAEMRGRPSR